MLFCDVESGKLKTTFPREFPGCPVIRIRHFHCRGPGPILGQRNKILQAVQHEGGSGGADLHFLDCLTARVPYVIKIPLDLCICMNLGFEAELSVET